MMHYIRGDATNPIGEGRKLICHICNDIGKWGAGFVLALNKKSSAPMEEYRKWWFNGQELDEIYGCTPFKLGEIQLVHLKEQTWVVNMIAQHNIRYDRNNLPPIRYDAVQQCLHKVNELFTVFTFSVHMPRIGCGLAGGTWEKIEPIIAEELKTREVFVYDL